MKHISCIFLFLCIILGSSVYAAIPYGGLGLGMVVNTANKGDATSYRGLPFNLFVGYGGMLNPIFYVAGELAGTITTIQLSSHDWQSNLLRSTYSYGASIIPGMVINDEALLFARIGVIRTHFSAATNNRTGGEVGLGLQTSITQDVDLRGEYDFSAYQSFSSHSHSVSPRQDTFNVGLVYKFG